MKLPRLIYWHDRVPRAGALNMALDEAMLAAASDPWLRAYHWEKPAISIGFSQNVTAVPAPYQEWPVVRRWTGGGVVVHDGDWTYTIVAPQGHVLCDQPAPQTYHWIHEGMIAALEEVGVTGCTLQPLSTSDGMGVCFVEPAKHDVLYQGQKIAGAGQRRTRGGLLHQGTLQPVKVPEDFGMMFAKHLAESVIEVKQDEVESLLLPAAEKLVAQKYGAESWIKQRSVAEAETTA
jgi:lipoyl(octanoyl) transferase